MATQTKPETECFPASHLPASRGNLLDNKPYRQKHIYANPQTSTSELGMVEITKLILCKTPLTILII